MSAPIASSTPHELQLQQPRPNAAASPAPRFSAGLPSNAVAAFWNDTMSVYVPKLPTVRSKAQLFEETFLEGVEDGAFYFMIPVVGPVLGKWFGKAARANADEIGVRTVDLLKRSEGVGKNLLGAKAASVLGILALAGGYEYLIQPVRNMITAKLFNAKNFTAVAGLEQARTEVNHYEDDPIAKGKARLAQVGLVTAGLLGAAAAAPWLVRNVKPMENLTRNLLKYVDFGGTRDAVTGAIHNGFDLSKALQSLVIFSGVASYLDASRDALERKETAARLGIVVPNLIFGRELASNAMASMLERVKLRHNGQQVTVKELLPLLKEDAHAAFRKAWTAEHFLDMNAVRGDVLSVDLLSAAAPKLGKAMKRDLSKNQILKTIAEHPEWSNEVKQGLRRVVIGHSALKWVLSTLVMGTGFGLLNNEFTRIRYRKLQESEKAASQAQGAPVHAASGTRAGTLTLGEASPFKLFVASPQRLSNAFHG